MRMGEVARESEPIPVAVLRRVRHSGWSLPLFSRSTWTRIHNFIVFPLVHSDMAGEDIAASISLAAHMTFERFFLLQVKVSQDSEGVGELGSYGVRSLVAPEMFCLCESPVTMCTLQVHGRMKWEKAVNEKQDCTRTWNLAGSKWKWY